MEVSKVLLISGSDSSGGAGMQADIAACRHMGVYPLCAVTCITAQGAGGLSELQPVSPEILRSQLESTLESGLPDAVKIGLIPDPELAETVADFITEHELNNVVADPVLTPTMTSIRLDTTFWLDKCFLQTVLPRLTLLTPNLAEASRIIGISDETIRKSLGEWKSLEEIKSWMIDYKLQNLLITSADASKGEWIINTLYADFGTKEPEVSFSSQKRIKTQNTHGTGCTLSSYIAAGLACGLRVDKSWAIASACVYRALKLGRNTSFYPEADAYGPTLLKMPELPDFF